ncbi:hormone-sensitive lipase isoform X2 [Rhinatrema bivittatum]|uniref:hormone-sensitive lipase isoform X2 n=1 Tax=Rhinatrema bivittatum TaxID=194408 RepID=UPI00112CC838|nr:hormone-sensitive lipase isoform X2 [Rhinatrema bivittatum]
MRGSESSPGVSGGGAGAGAGESRGQRRPRAAAGPLTPETMDARPMFQALHAAANENIIFFRESSSETAKRFVLAFAKIQEHARSLEPTMSNFASIYHIFDFEVGNPANGYRSLMKVVNACLQHIIHKSRYVAANCRSVFFRASHNCAELEAYCMALTQLRALVYFAQRLLTANRHGNLFFEEDSGLSEEFLQQYATMHKGCFYGRCLGFQFTPSIRPFLQTISIGLVSFGENYKKHESGISVAASSFFTSGKYAIDPELRGMEFERIIQNLDVNFWKHFWNITEMEVLSSLANMASTTVRVNKILTIPPNSFELPLAADPQLTVTITPPVAHTGPGAVHMRLISYELREGQDSEELNSFAKSEGPLGLDLRLKNKRAPRSRFLIVHFHGGGFVAQTSKSHEPYLKNWAHELEAPILSIDYSLAPAAPFPRALEECFYAYCWAIKNCLLLGTTAERICLAGDSAGGNLCITVSMRAAAYGIRMPDGIMAAYPVTLLQATASPSRLLTLVDPLLPLSVLSKCLSAYTGTEPMQAEDSDTCKLNTMSLVKRDTALLFRDLRQGASAWISSLLENRRGNTDSVRQSVSEAAFSEDPVVCCTGTVKSKTCQDLWKHRIMDNVECTARPEAAQEDPEGLGVSFFLPEENKREEKTPIQQVDSEERVALLDFPEGFQPLRSDQSAINLKLQTSPIVKNPFMSPLLAPDSMLRGLPPVHLVACALDPMLDDSVMFARRLRALGQLVTLEVVEDLPHGFLSLSQLSRETREATAVCIKRIQEIFVAEPPPPVIRKHRRLERMPALPYEGKTPVAEREIGA